MLEIWRMKDKGVVNKTEDFPLDLYSARHT